VEEVAIISVTDADSVTSIDLRGWWLRHAAQNAEGA
jgi:hypothetical protein